ncbi:MAG: hypothetical protein WBA48_03445 [Xanthobacteraceae bacterium]
MVDLVTVDQVDKALKLGLAADVGDSSAGDGDTSRLDDITLKISQATDIVLDFIQPKPDPEWTIETVPARVTAAIIITVRCLLDDTEESLAMLTGLSGKTGPDPKNPIAALLWRLRDPSMA